MREVQEQTMCLEGDTDDQKGNMGMIHSHVQLALLFVTIVVLAAIMTNACIYGRGLGRPIEAVLTVSPDNLAGGIHLGSGSAAGDTEDVYGCEALMVSPTCCPDLSYHPNRQTPRPCQTRTEGIGGTWSLPAGELIKRPCPHRHVMARAARGSSC